jgi:hypothetical protein
MHYLGDDEVGFIVSLDGSLLTMYPITGDEEFDNEAGRSIQLDPNKYRLCRLVDVEDSAQPPVPVPDDVSEAIGMLLRSYLIRRGPNAIHNLVQSWLDSVTVQPQE